MRPNYPSTDDLSEISGRTGSTSGRSAFSDNRDEIYAFLGISQDEPIIQERFRIDRKKMEQMILDDNETLDRTQSFFQKIQERTGTHVTWPSRLKIGAKSKKDPYVKVSGVTQPCVQAAKEEILSVLGIRNNQVTMKLNVSYTHHSHIIGEAGQTITKVRQLTGCHIHFPDSNRTSTDSKSNQVSITGPIQGVEKARARVRELVPLVFCFEPPLTGNIQTQTEHILQYCQTISHKYNVHVQQKTRSRFHSTLIIVKGCEWELESVKEATTLLISHICGDLADQVSVHMTMEITPLHHTVVKGPHSSYLRAIMENTKTHIMFLDANDPNIPDIKKSSVTITGQIDNVYEARQQMMGSLPIYLTFSVPDDMLTLDTNQIEQLEDSMDVSISVRQCPKQNSFTVNVKGVERNVHNIYEARRVLLKSDFIVPVCIPSNYMIPNPPKVFSKKFEYTEATSPLPNFPTITGPILSPISPLDTPTYLMPPMYGNMWGAPFPSVQSLPWNPMFPPQIMIPRAGPTATMTNKDLSVDSSGYASFNNMNNISPVSENTGWFSSLSSTASSFSTPTASPRNMSPTISKKDISFDLAKVFKITPEWKGKCPPGFENTQPTAFPMDYEQKRAQSVRALDNQLDPNELRIPTSIWSGYGLSSTSPSSVLKEQKHARNMEQDGRDMWQASFDNRSQCNGDSAMRMPYLSQSNNIESSSRLMSDVLPHHADDLPTVLVELGLEKYLHIFKSQEIDLATFINLNNSDLQEIGINTYGARLKLMMAITELKKRLNQSAPGAERNMPKGW